MFQLDPRSDLTRLAGLAVWLSVGIFLPLCTDPAISPAATALLYLAFGVLFWIGSGAWLRVQPAAALALLAGQSLCALFLMHIHPFFMMTGLLVITGWQVALRLGLASACLWIVAQTFAGGALLAASIGLPLLVSSVGAVIGFQLFALACADVTRQERRARSALDAALVELGAAQKALLAQERAGERLRIARDLHDDLGHGLTAIGLLAARAEMETADPGAQAQAAVLKREASGLLAQLRATVTDLRSDETSAAARIDLAAALGAIARPGVWPLAIHVDLAPEAATMAAEPGIAIVRLVREAITNAVRHGGAAVSAVHIGILAQSGRWHIAVCDDGGGAAAPCLGNGLSGMRERIEALGGSLHIDSQPGAGWRLSASVPQARR